MIQYTLKCSQDHRFDSWFQSADAYEKLKAAGMVTCSVCGDMHVEKALMAPRVRPARNARTAQPDPSPAPPPAPSPAAPGPLKAPSGTAEQALVKLRQQVESNSDYVGMNFAKEARAMHLGDAPARAIYGEAGLKDAKALLEDGIPVMPLPFVPGRKSN